MAAPPYPGQMPLDFDTRASDLHSLRVIYAATITGGELRREVGGSTDDVGWFAVDEVVRLERVGLVDAAIRVWHAH